MYVDLLTHRNLQRPHSKREIARMDHLVLLCRTSHIIKIPTRSPLRDLSTVFSVEDMQVLQLILQALILCCVANSENQSMIVRGNVGESIRWILAVTLPSSRGSQYPTEVCYTPKSVKQEVEAL